MDRKLRNRILLFLVLAAVVAYVLVYLSGRQPAAKISAVLPTRENLVASISSNGKVEPISPYIMRAPIATFIEKVYVLEGQSVKKGQPILDLNVKDVAAQHAQARVRLLRAQDDARAARTGGRPDDAARISGDLTKAKAQRDRLLRESEALKRLLAQQAATRDELAANEVELARAQAEYERAAAAKQEFDRQAKLDAERTTLQVEQASDEVASLGEKVRTGHITAPSDGTVYSLPARTGNYANVGDLLAEMADLHQVRVRAFIDEPELGGLEPDEPVDITWDALPNRSWQGRTTVIPKQVVARNTRSVGELLCAVTNDKLELLPNTNVNVRINAKERLHVLAVPRGAVELEGGRRYVYVVKNNDLGVGKKHLEKRQVQVGIASATSYEIVGGLQEGEPIALPGDVDLKDGMAVLVVNQE
jgi:RND family efflux transporter MFP subunit